MTSQQSKDQKTQENLYSKDTRGLPPGADTNPKSDPKKVAAEGQDLTKNQTKKPDKQQGGIAHDDFSTGNPRGDTYE